MPPRPHAASTAQMLALAGRVATGLHARPILPQGRVPMKNGLRWLVVPAFLGVTATAAAQGDWTTYGGNDWNQRYSTLKRSAPRTSLSWSRGMIFQTGISKLGSFENTPIVVDNVMYVTTPFNTAIAYDLDDRQAGSGATSTSWAPRSSVAARTTAAVAIHGAARLHGHPRRAAGRARSHDRRGGVGQGSRRSHLRLQHHAMPRSSSATS